MREKLIELLQTSPMDIMGNHPVGSLADWLIANGVTIPVRCKDCKKGRPIDKTRCPEKYFRNDCVVCECEEVVGDEPMVYDPTHFCSYGERRTDG